MNRNLTPYALGAVALVLAAGLMSFIPLGLAVVFAVIVILALNEIRSRENRAREEGSRPDPAGAADDGRGWQPPSSSARPPQRGWSAAGSMLAVFAAVGGLAVLGLVILLFVALSSSNFKLGNK